MDTDPVQEDTAAQEMPTFSIMCLDSSDMPPSEDLFVLDENFRFPDVFTKEGNVESCCTIDRGEIAKAAGMEIEMHESGKWRCSIEERERAAVHAAAIISNHWTKHRRIHKII